MKNVTNLLTAYPCSNPVLQTVWDYVRFNHEATVRSPTFPVFLAFSSYLTFCTPFTLIDLMGERLPFLYKHKIQKEKYPSLRLMAQCIWQAVFNHLVYIFPAVIINWFWRPPSPLPDTAPTFAEFLVGILSCLLVFDFQYYFWHKLHHNNRWLYKTFHAIHHNHVSPFSWSTQYLGGWELLTVGFWSNTTPLLFKCHPLTTWGFMLISIWMSVEDHVGYDLPWAFNKILPLGLCGGASAHDMHHQKPNTNYAPFFTHMDRLFGTIATEDH
ncbi:cholesterol 25-hydroxylase-like protein 1, member 1 [Callorhinchus milii]|uniref:cholesterol 25-hydroxylase-like protein 1, member 1 n=1 Tax=Callorhinchus milii TaxID=7868 RepID=UPI00045762EE|nr:cholesterol 25-hydroxylase-like protein 1, member 1 [Callorhinchus milii]|eukprot:gi/632979114/ref/XP_007906288.1/ PREDICTED: cholesterol 25-hydroxylase-like protein 1, member 1 [Callorhinchus milii]